MSAFVTPSLLMAIRCTYWTNGTQSWEEWVGRGGGNKQLPEAPKRLFIQVWGVLFAMRRRYSSAQMRLAAVLRQFCSGEVLGGEGWAGMCFGVHQAWCLCNEGLDMLRQCQVIYWIWSSYYRKTSLKNKCLIQNITVCLFITLYWCTMSIQPLNFHWTCIGKFHDTTVTTQSLWMTPWVSIPPNTNARFTVLVASSSHTFHGSKHMEWSRRLGGLSPSNFTSVHLHCSLKKTKTVYDH